MAMEHKAYLFHTDSFSSELCNIIIHAGETNNKSPLEEFIESRLGSVWSVYTGELLTNDWQSELENGGVQELSDFAMTVYYSPDDERGLSYDWDVLLETLYSMSPSFDPDYSILGCPIQSESFTLDPGGMGLGLVHSEDVPSIYNELVQLKGSLANGNLPPLHGVIYPSTLVEITEAYDVLISLYKDAKRENCGLLMTF